ncbi:MAG: glutamate--tRNA ligase, partial [Acidimicrobiales bacterium]
AKLSHLNGEYIRAMTLDAFIEACRPWLTGDRVPWPPANFDEDGFAAMAPLVQERVATLGEVPTMVDFLFLDEPVLDEDAWASAVTRDGAAAAVLSGAVDAYSALGGDWTRDALYAATRAVGDRVGRKLNKAQAPVRVAVTGRRVGPPLFEALEVMGRDRVLARLTAAHARATADRDS